jgi:membrane-bound metal-dependent hydrolase YbcI (DUF457 family)
MKIPEHLTMSYLLAQLGPQQAYGTTGTVLVIVAGMLPDLDGVSILGGWRCHLKYHRKIGHGLAVALLGPLLLALWRAPELAKWSWLGLWAWLQVSLLLHLAVDVLFYRWRVQLFWPVSNWGTGVGLIGWNDLVPTLLLYTATGAALVWPAEAPLLASAGLGLLGLYIACRAWRGERPTGWRAWFTGDWARRSPRVCRWLTGDFVT